MPGPIDFEIWQALMELVDVERARLAIEQQILNFLLSPAGFNITETAVRTNKEKTMTTPVRKATADFVILDDGKGVLFTLAPVNAAGAVIPWPAGEPAITGVSSAPASLTNPVPDPGDPSATPP